MSLSKLNGTKKIGLIAGNGQFPLLFARAAAKHGLEVVAIAIKRDTSFLISPLVKKVYWLELKDYQRMFDIFKAEGVKKAIMAGQVNPRSLFHKDLGDGALKRLLAAIQDKRPDTVFGAVADELAKHSIELVDSTILLENFLAEEGVLTNVSPDSGMMHDITFGFEMAKRLAGLDIGQTLVVKNGAIIAVEAIEGTDAAILRAGILANGGIVVIKVSKPNQDMRFDVPVIGPRTIKFMIQAKARCLAIEAKRTLVIDRAQCVRLAEKHKIAIIAFMDPVGK